MTKHFLASALVLGFSVPLLSGCGFQPVYGEYSSSQNAIQVLEIESRIGHRLRQELSRTLSKGIPGVEPGAFLTVRVFENTERLSLKADAGVSRTTLNSRAQYILRDSNTEILLQGSVSAQADFDVASTDFGDIALQTDARERVAYLLSQRIHQQLILDQSSERQKEQMESEAIDLEAPYEDDPELDLIR